MKVKKYDLLSSPEAAAFPTIAFQIASWIWSKNAFLILTNSTAKQGDLSLIADGTYHKFSLITHSFTDNIEHLKERTTFYEDIVRELGCLDIKRGRGVTCEIKSGSKSSLGFAVPVCLLDFKRSYCGCEGQFSLESCPYGKNSAGVCRNPTNIKCCYEKCDSALDLVIIMVIRYFKIVLYHD